MKFYLLVFLFPLLSFAQSEAYPTENSEAVPVLVKPETSSVEKVMESKKEVPEEITEIFTTAELRSKTTGTAMIGYQYLASWIPSKKTLSYTHIINQKWSLEGEYSWSSLDIPMVAIDLGGIKEKRYILQARNYMGNSFNFTFGAVLNDLSARLGNDFVSQSNAHIGIQNIGITAGMGNRWQWKSGFTFGVDWVKGNMPVVTTSVDDKVLDSLASKTQRNDIKKVISAFNHLPTFVLLGVNLGYSF